MTLFTLRHRFLSQLLEWRTLMSFSVSLVFQVQEREGAVDMGQVGGPAGADVALVELLEAGNAQKAHRLLHLLLEKLDHALDAGGARRREAVAVEATHADPVGAHADRLHDIGATAEATIDDHLGAALHRLDDLGQHLGGAAAVVELAAAMVRAIDTPDAVLQRDLGIFSRADALQQELHIRELLAQAL